jgi:hypothetical protein
MPDGPRYAFGMSRSLVQQLHNPRNRSCFCDPDCWCRRTALGRAVKWWFPARYFGIRHKGGGVSPEWKRLHDPNAG